MVGGYKAIGSMRLANQNNPFFERETKSGMKLPKSQYIIFAEGVETEKLYFESLSRSKRKKENVIIKYLDRWKVNSGRSNQLNVVKDVIDYVADFSWYEKVAVNGQKYLLVHGGLGNFDIKRDIDDYSLDELVWSRVDYDVRYFDDVITVTGHTPTRYIEDNPRPGYVYRKNNHIDIDCGAYLPGGRLAAICLDTGEEFYSSGNDKDWEFMEECT